MKQVCPGSSTCKGIDLQEAHLSNAGPEPGVRVSCAAGRRMRGRVSLMASPWNSGIFSGKCIPVAVLTQMLVSTEDAPDSGDLSQDCSSPSRRQLPGRNPRDGASAGRRAASSTFQSEGDGGHDSPGDRLGGGGIKGGPQGLDGKSNDGHTLLRRGQELTGNN